jgi:hypothetical protein
MNIVCAECRSHLGNTSKANFSPRPRRHNAMPERDRKWPMHPKRSRRDDFCLLERICTH